METSFSITEERRRTYLEQLFRAHYTDLFTVARAHGTRNAADAQDAVQIIFGRLFTKRADLLDAAIGPPPSSEGADKVTHYLYGSLRGQMWNASRRENIRNRRLATAEELLRPSAISQPDDDLAARELAQHLGVAVKCLSLQEWHVFRCIRMQNLTYAATASLLGISTSSVQVYYNRATRKLRAALAPHLSPSQLRRFGVTSAT